MNYDFQCVPFCFLPVAIKCAFSISELMFEFNSFNELFSCLCKVSGLLDMMHKLSCPDTSWYLSLVLGI